MASIHGLDDPFLSQIEEVRAKIGKKFARAHQVLREREEALLLELRQLEAIYKGEELGGQVGETALGGEVEILKRVVAQSDARVREIKQRFEKDRVSMGIVVLEWDFEGRIGEVGTIKVYPVPDYKKKGKRILSVGRHTIKKCTVPEVFYFPQSIHIDSLTNNVFVCDGGNDRVQVYNKLFQLLFEFVEKMDKPYGICSGHQKVYVTQRSSHCLNVYTEEGKLLHSVGSEGSNELEFHSPTCVAVSTENGRIYVCEGDNNRVQCLNMNLSFHSYISDFKPRDIKLTSEEIVISDDQLIRYYNYSHQFVRKLGYLSNTEAVNPRFFCLDLQGNLIITDYSANCVFIISPTNELINKIEVKTEGKNPGGLLRPTGVVLDSENRILVVSQNYGHCIQLF